VVGAASEAGRFGIPSWLTSHAQVGPLTARAEVIRGTERAIETTLANENMVVSAGGGRRFGSNGELGRSKPETRNIGEPSRPLLYLSSAHFQI